MKNDANTIIPETETNQDNAPASDMTDDEKIDVVAARILERFKPAFEELAK